MPRDDGVFEPVLEQLMLGSRTYFGVEHATITPDRQEERPFSHILRARVESAVDHRAIYIKVQKVPPSGPSLEIVRARLQRDFETTARIHSALRDDPHTGAVRPVACFVDQLALVTEEVPGLNLLALLQRDAVRWRSSALAPLERLFERAGEWVRRFQEIEGAASTFSYDGLREYVDLRLRRLVAEPRSHFVEGDRGRLLDYLERRRADIDPADLVEVAVHADFAPANVMASGARVVVLDFAMNHRGAHFHDLARFYAQMELLTLKPQFRPETVRALQAALLRGYRPDLVATRPLFEVLLVLHTVNHLGTLVTRPATFSASVYNRFVARRHRRWIRETVGLVCPREDAERLA